MNKIELTRINGNNKNDWKFEQNDYQNDFSSNETKWHYKEKWILSEIGGSVQII